MIESKEVQTFTPAQGVESYMLGVISTGYVTEASSVVLDNARELNIFFVQPLQYGWLINFWSDNNDDPEMHWKHVLKQHGIDEGTIDNLQRMQDKGYSVVMLDRDGDDEIEFLDWLGD